METRNYSDEQILGEVTKTLADPRLRQCYQCVYGEDCTECKRLHIPISRYQYAGACKFYMTNEELMLQQTRDAIARLEKEEKKINHILTMTLNHIEVAMLFLEDFASRVEKEYKRAERKGVGDAKVRKNDRQWIGQLSRAYKNMLNGMEGVRRQYNHYVEPQLNKVFMDKETNTYDAKSYDDHLSDANELARLSLLYFDKAYLNAKNAEDVFALLNSQEGSGVMEDEDFNHYDLRR